MDFEKHIIDEIHGLKESIDELKGDITGLKIRVSELTVKTGYWGFLGGGIVVIISIGVSFIRSNF